MRHSPLPTRRCLLLAVMLHTARGFQLTPQRVITSSESPAEATACVWPGRALPDRCGLPMCTAQKKRWVVGMNQYSHDAGVCLLSLDGEDSVIVPKERVTRVKHDGGDCALAMETALEAVGASLDDVVVACANNHHFRIAPFEARAPWTTRLGIYPQSTLSPYNLLPGTPKHEVSHHLAHAWSVLTHAPFDEGLIVVMDGMGETRDAMERGTASGDARYTHDAQLAESDTGFQQAPVTFAPSTYPDPGPSSRPRPRPNPNPIPSPSLSPSPSPRPRPKQVPVAFAPSTDYREAETVYSFRGTELKRVYKRWQEHRSPSELYNHGFENMESLGAVSIAIVSIAIVSIAIVV